MFALWSKLMLTPQATQREMTKVLFQASGNASFPFREERQLCTRTDP